jgi:DNA-binding HxlR family transcriptional regulator
VRFVTDGFDCPVEYVLHLLGGKWRAVLLAHLKQGERRYGELRRLVPRLSEKMLTQRLHELTSDGLIERRADGSYRLTARGDRLRPVLQALYELGTELAAETGVAIGPGVPAASGAPAAAVSRPTRRP